MKKLQNGFTTQEQSKRLLELGVPADSADCYYNTDGENIGVLPDNTTFGEFNKSIKRVLDKELSLCWSVGRLLEIMDICTSFNPNMALWDIREHGGSMIENIIYIFDEYTQAFNFSKLEN